MWKSSTTPTTVPFGRQLAIEPEVPGHQELCLAVHDQRAEDQQDAGDEVTHRQALAEQAASRSRRSGVEGMNGMEGGHDDGGVGPGEQGHEDHESGQDR